MKLTDRQKAIRRINRMLKKQEIVLNYEQTFAFKGLEVTVKAKPSKNIYWCSHWEVIDDLVKAGLIHRTFSRCGEFNHWEYILKDLDTGKLGMKPRVNLC